jgi:hypothetical protein
MFDMGITRRKFTLEFKTEAALRVIDTGRSVFDLASELSVADGDRYHDVLAEMALTRMRSRIPEHHALMISGHVAHIGHLSADINRLDAEVDLVVALR